MTKFERYPFDETEVEDNVKVCMFYLLEAVLLAGDKRKSVSRDHFKIIQNLKLRERYPWGSLSYDIKIKSLRSVVNHNNTSNTYSLSDFPIAFQDVDDTTMDPPSEQVQPDRHPFSHHMHFIRSLDVARLENKLDDLNRKVQLIMQHLSIEGDTMELSERSIVVYSGSLRTPPSQIHDHRDIFIERVTIVDVFFWESFHYHFEAHAPVMQKKYIHPSERLSIPSRDWTLDMNDDTMTNYVKGISPLLSRSWKDVDRVYALINNEDKYWLAAEVDLVRRHVTLYDSSCSVSNDWFQTYNVESLEVLFP
ncbi:hypothetical protein FNV43_RR10438 [Rhamnella rubrinervis]|uniref:DUF1985 domain-containing protein n=1 Tax=Rhamnella rubrinervis TaxID=2594499 RepID=A0A8K0MKV7_9ROSA|nr:hypothetical protein FNV43_RR10438 [Rhamnella rubrinervis]